MNVLHGLILASVLLVGTALAQDKPKGYDLGACSPSGFFAAHVVLQDKQLTMDLISEKEGEVEKTEKPVVYKLEAEKGSKQIYVLQTKEHKFEIALDFEEKKGLFVADDQPQAVLFMTEDADGSKLAGNAMDQFKACIDLVNADRPENDKS